MRKLSKIPGAVLSDNLAWYDPQEHPELVFGLDWFSRERLYRRLPKSGPEPFPESVEQLAWHTAGAQLRFVTDSRSLTLRVTLSGPPSMIHMPATGQCGFDCYLDKGQGLFYYATTKYPTREVDQTIRLFQMPDARFLQVVIHFPLYQGVTKLAVGIDPDATIFEPWPFADDRRVVFYGTSITQGGCASRPGMCYTNLVSDTLNLPCVNLGFSGSGRGEPVMARLIASMDNLALIVLDYEANAGYDGLRQTLPAFLDILRENRPDTPILVLSKPRYAQERFETALRKARLQGAAFQRDLVRERRERGDTQLHFMNGARLLGQDFDRCSVDGVHPNDLGFWRMARTLSPVVNRLLLRNEDIGHA